MSTSPEQQRLQNQKNSIEDESSAHVIDEDMSRAEWLAASEEAVTPRTPDPLAESSK